MSGAKNVSRSTQDSFIFGVVYLLGAGDLRNRGIRPVLQHLPPAKRPSDRLDHGIADAGPRCTPAVKIVPEASNS
jgi:hypothetical protein